MEHNNEKRIEEPETKKNDEGTKRMTVCRKIK